MTDVGATEWGVDYRGGILHMPSREMALKVAARNGVDAYSRPPMGAWTKADK